MPDTTIDKLSLRFRTTQKDAVLVYVRSKWSEDFLEMELVSVIGRLVIGVTSLARDHRGYIIFWYNDLVCWHKIKNNIQSIILWKNLFPYIDCCVTNAVGIIVSCCRYHRIETCDVIDNSCTIISSYLVIVHFLITLSDYSCTKTIM